MDYNKLTIDQLKDKLDEKGIDYSEATKKQDFIDLLPVEDAEAEETTDSISDKFNNLAQEVKAEEEPKAPSRADILRRREPGTLTRSQRLLLQSEAVPYPNVDGGKYVGVNERYSGNHVSLDGADGKRYDFKKGVVYTVSEEDYAVIMRQTMRVKTEATKNKCCGNAKFEDAPALVDVEV